MLYNRQMKIGIYGGTFDPVHNGHIMAARAVMKQLKLDRVLFIVAGDPPHKQGNNITCGEVRLNMLREALRREKRFIASDIELKRGGVSYTVDTLRQLRTEYRDAKFFFLVGADMLRDFANWYEPEEIMKLATLTAIGRKQDGFSTEEQHDELVRIAAEIENRFGGKVILINSYGPDISSTMIRNLVRDAKPVSQYLPLEAEKLIFTKYLYFDEDTKHLCERIKERLDESRFEHTMLVAREAVMIAERYGVDTKKARLAGMLHDCMRIGKQELFEYAERYGIELTDEDRAYPFVIHGILGADAAERIYGVHDEAVIQAIRNHTIGSTDMSMLDKVLYLADKIEPSRTYRRIEHLRKLAYEDIDLAVCGVMKHTMRYTMSRGMAVHPDTGRIIAALEKNNKN